VTPFEGIRRGHGHVSPYQIPVTLFATIPSLSIQAPQSEGSRQAIEQIILSSDIIQSTLNQSKINYFVFVAQGETARLTELSYIGNIVTREKP
jgi:hypothetical protein